MTPKHPLFIGIDLGTSGVRACAITENKKVLHLCKSELEAPIRKGTSVTQDAQLWWQACLHVLEKLFQHIDPEEVQALSVNGTSGTVLACDKTGQPLAPARMYNDAQCIEQAQLISQFAAASSAANGPSSGLSKLLYLAQQHPEAHYYCHQADWITGQFNGHFNISDENNALKSGYDPQQGNWPDWLQALQSPGFEPTKLPKVVAPGTALGTIQPSLLEDGPFKDTQLNPQCQIISGTTDSIAAFIATGASQPGDAVTSLGSTLVLKIICEQPISSPEFGIYSHKLGKYWLAGGASNSGGAVLAHYFSAQQISQLSQQLQPEKNTGLNYYPLLESGERFPICDPELAPRMPAAHSELERFQAILEGIAQIELEGYKKLHQLGAPYPVRVLTAGGGSQNQAWGEMRQKRLGVDVRQAEHYEACYGSALLAAGYLK